MFVNGTMKNLPVLLIYASILLTMKKRKITVWQTTNSIHNVDKEEAQFWVRGVGAGYDTLAVCVDHIFITLSD
jgi:hypothetical protein